MKLFMHERGRGLLLPLVALLSLLGAAGCGKDSSGQTPGAGAPPPSEVVVKTLVSADIPLDLEYVGQVSGSREVQVRARVGGILLRRAYEEGAKVRQGDLLFEIDPEPLKAALEQAKGALGQSEARLASAKRNLDRMKKLRQADVISQKDIDDAQTEYESATADVRAAQGKVREAGINLSYTRVEAPITGITSKETKSEGSLIGNTADSSLLTTINRIDPVYVNFSIPGAESMKFRKDRAEGRIVFPKGGDFEVRLLLSDGTEYPHSGHINFMDTQVDAQTGVVKARAELPNPSGDILPGQFVRARLLGAVLKQSMTVPQGAVLRTQQGPMVWVVNAQDTVEPRPVTLGVTLGNNYLLESGVNSGERVIVEGVIKVRPGAPVRPRDIGQPAAPAQAPPTGQGDKTQAPAGKTG
ncbi:efflux RND transporter periplasmic adaptor subunit [Fundidesulfovibrio putealis]|uniref:efflux RND transporter periplasmic adaptor subunit n=1 Tax=Fundidesulfovibrio putealis TaxID=270496 RepID=UPI0004070CC7|nr:efflux RND transporter periplasmic adaptor subunit [Fundidesulfovibrio putealis]